MYQNEQFKQVGNIPAGELVVKFPGTDLKMLYEGGKAYVNKNDNIGQLALAIRDIATEEVGKAEGIVGKLGRQLVEQLNNPSIQLVLKEFLSKQDHHLFYSKAEDGTEILCIPGMSGEYQIDDQNIAGMVFATYSTQGEIPGAERVYNHHIAAVGNRKLITDRRTLEKEVIGLVPKANGVYDKILELIREAGF